MDIRFNCPACDHHMVIEETAAGMIVACPECGQNATVPKPPAPKPETTNERTVALKWTPPPASHPHVEPPKQ